MAANQQQRDKMQSPTEKSETKLQGLQTEFHVGEQVLCYEPDPSKAKMLYEAKILEIDITKDEKGKKVPEFFIHFMGWNKSWDRWVISDSVMRDCESSRGLQTNLYNKAVGSRKKSRSRRRKNDDDDESLETNSHSSQSTMNSSQAEGDESELPVVSINIPNILKLKLEDDCYNIKRKKKLLKLPRNPCALKILKDFIEFCEENNGTNVENVTPLPQKVSMDVMREVVQGLQTYLNFTLSTLLLYNFEREQYNALFPQNSFANTVLKTASPSKSRRSAATRSAQHLSLSASLEVSPAKRKYTRRQHLLSEEHEGSSETGSFVTTRSGSLSSPDIAKSKQEFLQVPKRRGRPSRKRKLESQDADVTQEVMQSDDWAEPKVEVKNEPTEMKIEDCEQVDDDTENNFIQPEEEREPWTPLSPDPNADDENLESGANAQFKDGKRGEDEVAEEQKAERQESSETKETSEHSEEAESIGRALRPRRSLLPPIQTKRAEKDSAREQASMPIGASASSMGISKPKKDSCSVLSKDAAHPQESSLIPFPLSHPDAKCPVEIYGAEHLLRLFVKLPSLLSRTDLDRKKLSMLVQYLEIFLKYLAENANYLFDSDAYSESVI